MSAMVVPNLYLGDARDAERMANKVAMVVNCTPDIPFYGDASLQAQVRIPVKDNGEAWQHETLGRWLAGTRVVDDIIRCVEGGQAGLVHCKAGQQRSAAVVAAVVMDVTACSAAEAVECVRMCKRDAFLGAVNFQRALDMFKTARMFPPAVSLT
jgi:hypothetical protein